MPRADAEIRITKILAPDELGAQIEAKMRNVGDAIGARAQRLVPKRSWDLHDSISAETERAGNVVTTTVGAGGGKVDYALYVELGTSKMSAQPYLRPAALQVSGSDFSGSGKGIVNHGVIVANRRQRARDRAADRRQSARENRAES